MMDRIISNIASMSSKELVGWSLSVTFSFILFLIIVGCAFTLMSIIYKHAFDGMIQRMVNKAYILFSSKKKDKIFINIPNFTFQKENKKFIRYTHGWIVSTKQNGNAVHASFQDEELLVMERETISVCAKGHVTHIPVYVLNSILVADHLRRGIQFDKEIEVESSNSDLDSHDSITK